MPPGPGIFSMTTPWPNFLLSRSAMMREVTSATPPAPNGSTILIGFSGQAVRACGTGASISKAPKASSVLRTCLMVNPPSDLFLLVETVQPGRIVYQQALLRQRVSRVLRHQIDQIGLVGLVRSVRVRKIGTPQHALRRRLDQCVRDQHRFGIRRHGNALGAADLDPAIFQARKL